MSENLFGESVPVIDRDHCWYCGCDLLDQKDADADGSFDWRQRIQSALTGKPVARNLKVLRMRTQDHLIPRVRGGTDTQTNLVYACMSCNATKGDKTLEEYRTWIYERTPEGCARKLAVEILGAWRSMPDECRENVNQLIVRIDSISPKSGCRFYGARVGQRKAEDLA